MNGFNYFKMLFLGCVFVKLAYQSIEMKLPVASSRVFVYSRIQQAFTASGGGFRRKRLMFDFLESTVDAHAPQPNSNETNFAAYNRSLCCIDL